MKYEEFEAQHLIQYTPDDLASLRKAMQEYISLLEKGEAFEDDYMVVHFEPSVSKIDLSFFKDHPHLITFLQESCSYYSEEKENLMDTTFTETLFFLCAAKQPELKEDLKQTCEALVKFARQLNDSSGMWLSCEYPFGVEPLQIVATTYPELGYLFAGFFVPNWDNEHMFESLGALANWSDRIGINEHTIKAFCYCDNKYAREMMLGYTSWDGMDEGMFIDTKFPLVAYLRRSIAAMDRFKEQLVRRFEDQPLACEVYEEYGEGNAVEDPITIMLTDMLLSVEPCDTWDDDFDLDGYLVKRLVHQSAILEIEEIQDLLKGKIFATDEETDQEEQEEEGSVSDESIQSLENWKEFILKAFSKGEIIWDYLVTGKHPEILKDLEEADLLQLAKKKKCALYKEWSEDCYNTEDFFEDLEEYVESLYQSFQQAKCRNKIGSIDDDKSLILRFSDVLYRWNGKKPFSDDYIEEICDTYAVCDTAEEFTSRFPIDWKVVLMEQTKKFTGYHGNISLQMLDDVANLINQHREEAVGYLAENFFNRGDSEEIWHDFSVPRRKLSPSEKICIALYLYLTDEMRQQEDELTKLSKDYIEYYGEELLLYSVHEAMDAPHDGDADYLTDEEKERFAASQEIKHYLQKGKLLSDENLSETETFEKVCSLMEQFLKEEDRQPVSDFQKKYDWFDDLDEKAQKQFLFAHLIAGDEAFSCGSLAVRFLKLIFRLAPIRVVHLLGLAYNEKKDFQEYDTMMFFLDRLNHHDLPKEAYWGYQLEQLIEGKGMDQPQKFLEILSELFSSEQKPDAKLKRGFDLLKYEDQLRIVDYFNSQTEKKAKSYFDYFLKRFQRMLMGEYVIADPVIYFYRKLEYQGIFQQYVNWTEWGKHKDLLNTLLHKTDTQITCTLSKGECEHKVYDKKGWGYLVIQKQGDQLIPLYGAELLTYLQKGFDEESIRHAQTHAVLVDENCPQENMDELLQLLEMDHKAHIVSEVSSYLKGENSLENIEHFLRCGMNVYQIDSFRNYNDYDFADLMNKLEPESYRLGVNALALISPKFLGPSSDQTNSGYYNQLMELGVDRYAIFKYLMSRKDWGIISSMAVASDISSFIKREKIQEQMNLLSIVSNYPQYHSFVLSCKNSKVPKFKKHVETLVKKHKIE